MPRGTDDTGFFAAFALMELADCHVPSASHSIPFLGSFFCSAPVTVNKPWETPVRMAS
jgi:hypothetical protein